MTPQEVMDLMQRYLDKDLSEEEMELLMKQLETDEESREMFERMKRLSADLENLPKVSPPRSIVDSILPELEKISLPSHEDETSVESTVELGKSDLQYARAVRMRRFKIWGGWAAAAAIGGVIWFNSSLPQSVPMADKVLERMAGGNANSSTSSVEPAPASDIALKSAPESAGEEAQTASPMNSEQDASSNEAEQRYMISAPDAPPAADQDESGMTMDAPLAADQSGDNMTGDAAPTEPPGSKAMNNSSDYGDAPATSDQPAKARMREMVGDELQLESEPANDIFINSAPPELDQPQSFYYEEEPREEMAQNNMGFGFIEQAVSPDQRYLAIVVQDGTQWVVQLETVDGQTVLRSEVFEVDRIEQAQWLDEASLLQFVLVRGESEETVQWTVPASDGSENGQ